MKRTWLNRVPSAVIGLCQPARRRAAARQPRLATAEAVEPRLMLSGLSLTIVPDTVREDSGATAASGTLSRTDASGDLVVHLESSDPSEATVPATVTIPSGSLSVSFSITAIDDTLLDGSQSVQITASTVGTAGPITVDTSYGLNGFASVPGQFAQDAAVLKNGQVIVVFSAGADFGVSRLNVDGSLDTSFGINGLATADISGQSDRPEAVAIQADGKIVVAGTGYNGPNFDYVMARFNTDGSLDQTFGSGGKVLIDMGPGSYNEIWDLEIQPDGKILAGGNLANSGTNLAVTRYNSNGTLDLTFGTNGSAELDTSSGSDRGHGIVLQPDGRIVIAGGSFGGNSTSKISLARLTSSGQRDTGFGSNGVVLTDLPGLYEQGSEVALQDDGKLLVVGRIANDSVFPLEYDPVVLRYLPNGALDPTFGTSGVGYTITSGVAGSFSNAGIAQLSDGRIVATASGSSAPLLNIYGSTGQLQQTIPLPGSHAVQVTVSAFDEIYVVSGNSPTATGVTKLVSTSATSSAVLTVTDHETLDLVFAGPVIEGELLEATLTRSNSDTDTDVTVSLRYSDSAQLTGPSSVVIPAGAASVTFFAEAVQDLDLDGDVSVNVTANAAGYVAASEPVVVIDSRQIRIDLLPDDDQNQASSKTRQIAVTLFSSAGFDATAVDISTLQLSDGVSESSVSYHKKRGYKFTVSDVDNDGRADLTVWFDVQDLNRSGGLTTLTLRGVASDGGLFAGSDEIEFRGGRGKRNR